MKRMAGPHPNPSPKGRGSSFSILVLAKLEPVPLSCGEGPGVRSPPYSGATLVSAGRFLLIEINKATNTMRGAEGSTAVLA